MKPTSRLLGGMSLGLLIAAMPTIVHPAFWPVVVIGWLALFVFLGFERRILACGLPELKIQHAPNAYVGESFRVKLQFDWELLRPTVATLLAETELPLLPGDEVQFILPPGESEVSLTLTTPHRGKGELLAIWIQLEGPFGLLSKILRVPVDTPSIMISPSLPRVRSIALHHFGAWQLHGGVRLERMRGDGSEFDALEKYVPGHDPRSVDWKASARHQKLTVQRFRVERNQRLVFCVDTGHLMVDPIEQYQRLDHAIHASLLLSYFALKAGDLVGLYTYADKPDVWLPPATSMRSFQRINHACSEVFTKDVETNHVLGLHHLLTQLKRRTLVVVFSEFTHATTAELMIETLERLVRKHLVIFVAFDDPIVEHPLGDLPGDTERMARAVVASDLRAERHKVFKRLKRAGVHIVHGLPEIATVQLVARYTEIKRRELIG